MYFIAQWPLGLSSKFGGEKKRFCPDSFNLKMGTCPMRMHDPSFVVDGIVKLVIKPFKRKVW
jgi:hypothetical protein